MMPPSAQSADTCRIDTRYSKASRRRPPPILILVAFSSASRHPVHIMTFRRTNESINKAEDVGRMDAQIGLVDALRRFFLTNLASYLESRCWIDQEILCDRMSVIFDLRQCGG